MHVQSSGRRFATGGADALVKVWSLAPVLDAQKEQAGPLVLATLSDHTSTVNTVRFSKNGKYLASGEAAWFDVGQAARACNQRPRSPCRRRRQTQQQRAIRILACSVPALLLACPPRCHPRRAPGSDDKMICIFEHKPGPGTTVLGGGSMPNIENWRTRAVLRGHSNNVVDLGWSPDDSKLASASIDNAVCIWDAASGHLLKRLDFHTSFVKGLAWDPVGTYLATQVCAGWWPVERQAAGQGWCHTVHKRCWVDRAGAAEAPAHGSQLASLPAVLLLPLRGPHPSRRLSPPQSEDKSVVIWRCDDWSVQVGSPAAAAGPCLPARLQCSAVHRAACRGWSLTASAPASAPPLQAVVKSPYTKLVTSTFSTRMSWSPDGSFLATGGCRHGLHLPAADHTYKGPMQAPA